MSRLSRDQQGYRRVRPVRRSNNLVHRSNGHCCTGKTKETPHKGVSLPEIQTQESSPFGEAASSWSVSEREGERRGGGQSVGSEANSLLSDARIVFPKRKRLVSTDVFGRESEIDTRLMGETAYQALLEACKNPVRFDGLPEDYQRTPVAPAPKELGAGYKLGPETGMPLPEWWELPSAQATVDEIQQMILRNLERAGKEGKGGLSRMYSAHLARLS